MAWRSNAVGAGVTMDQLFPSKCASVPAAPDAQTFASAVPETPNRSWVVGLGVTSDQLDPFQRMIVPLYPTAKAFAAAQVVPRHVEPPLQVLPAQQIWP